MRISLDEVDCGWVARKGPLKPIESTVRLALLGVHVGNFHSVVRVPFKKFCERFIGLRMSVYSLVDDAARDETGLFVRVALNGGQRLLDSTLGKHNQSKVSVAALIGWCEFQDLSGRIFRIL